MEALFPLIEGDPDETQQERDRRYIVAEVAAYPLGGADCLPCIGVDHTKPQKHLPRCAKILDPEPDSDDNGDDVKDRIPETHHKFFRCPVFAAVDQGEWYADYDGE